MREHSTGLQSAGTEIGADMRLMRNEGVVHADSGWISVTQGDCAEVFVLQGSSAALNLMGEAGTPGSVARKNPERALAGVASGCEMRPTQQ